MVQSSNFHDRKQKTGESVDSYAQELRRLFYKAYPATARGSKKAEEMGEMVLASQFAAGLLPKLKVKVAGSDGSLEKLLTTVRFEEARVQELKPPEISKKTAPHPTAVQGGLQKPKSTEQKQEVVVRPTRACYNCGSSGHLANRCPNRGRARPVESRPSTQPTQRQDHVAALTPSGGTDVDELKREVAELKRQFQEAERAAVVSDVAQQLHGIEGELPATPLGPLPTAEVEIEGIPR